MSILGDDGSSRLLLELYPIAVSCARCLPPYEKELHVTTPYILSWYFREAPALVKLHYLDSIQTHHHLLTRAMKKLEECYSLALFVYYSFAVPACCFMAYVGYRSSGVSRMGRRAQDSWETRPDRTGSPHCNTKATGKTSPQTSAHVMILFLDIYRGTADWPVELLSG